MNNTIHFYSSKGKFNGHFIGFNQLGQKQKRKPQFNSTLRDKQNEWSFYGFSLTGSKDRTNNTNNFYECQKDEDTMGDQKGDE